MKREIIIYEFHRVGRVFKDKRMKLFKANDATMQFLRNKAVSQQDKQAVRSKRIRGIAFLGLNQVGDCRFATRSEDGKREYLQAIRFYGLHKKRPTSKNEIIDMMRNSDIGVYCNDPSFLFMGAAYNATKYGYNIVVENRPPTVHEEIKNKFVICKHLIAVLRAAPFYWNNMVGEYVKYFEIEKAELEPVPAPIDNEPENQQTTKQPEQPVAEETPIEKAVAENREDEEQVEEVVEEESNNE